MTLERSKDEGEKRESMTLNGHALPAASGPTEKETIARENAGKGMRAPLLFPGTLRMWAGFTCARRPTASNSWHPEPRLGSSC